jgi:hypothetical protein
MTISKNTQPYISTYLNDQKPPQEVAPYLDHPGSPPRHRGTAKSPAAYATIPTLPLPKRSGPLRHHHGEAIQSTTVSTTALLPQAHSIGSSGATSAPSLETKPLGWTQKQTPLHQ